MSLTVNTLQAKEILPEILKAKLVAMLHGSPAIGKSAIVHQVAAEYNLKVIDIRLSQVDPTELLGFPHIDEKTGRASYLPMAHFPLEGDKLSEGYAGWLLFLDEANHAPPAVQKASYKLVLDRLVGEHRLHDKCLCVLAGNLETDNALVEAMPTPLQSRLVHLELAVDAKVWVEWAQERGMDYRITSYLQHRPDTLYTFSADHTDKTYASPRTWDFADRLIRGKPLTDSKYIPLLAGTLGEGVAREFLAYCRVEKDLPKLEQIIKDPVGTPVSNEPATRYMLTGSIGAHASDKNITALMQYVRRLPIEFQVVTLRDVIRRHRELLQHEAVQQWVVQNSTELF